MRKTGTAQVAQVRGSINAYLESQGIYRRVGSIKERVQQRMLDGWYRLQVQSRGLVRDCKGQGTTEYAILVGVLVVIAIIAVVAFRGKLQELWGSISDGVNQL
jgi:Flp pilus assembly pilin Flp